MQAQSGNPAAGNPATGNIELGARVRTADDNEIGSIDKLILEPDSGDVRAIVVRKGLLLHDDIEIDLDGIAGQAQGVVLLRYTERQLDDLPRFHEDSYTLPPPERSAAYADKFNYPETAFLWPARGTASADAGLYGNEAVGNLGDEIRTMHREQDFSNAVIDEGSDVRSADDEKVGSVHRVIFDPVMGRPSAIVIRKGFLFTEDVELPASVIASVGDHVVYLNVDRDEVQRHAGKQRVQPPIL
jgi:uncharacterized protein YrrD